MQSIYKAPMGQRLLALILLFFTLTSYLAQAAALPQDFKQDNEKAVDFPDEDPGLDLSTDGPTTIVEDDGSNIVRAAPLFKLAPDALDKVIVPASVLDDIKKSLPQIMKEEGFTDAEIASLSEKELADILAGLKEFFEDGEGHDDSHEEVAIARRDELEARGIIDAIKRRACRVFARVTRPAFMAAAGLFNLKNRGSGSGIYQNQKFFLYPLHRRLFDDKINVRIYYKANWVTKRFWSSAGVSFGKKVFIRRSYDAWSKTSNNFYNQVSLLAHELQHTEQYHSRKWSIWDFAYNYLYHFCRAGFSYSKNTMERESRDAANKITKLLNAGRGFFLFWRKNALYSKLGYPVETSYRDVNSEVRELNFQKGKMQVMHKKSPDCFRHKIGNNNWTGWDCHAL